jgi:2-aminoadipate transaminase
MSDEVVPAFSALGRRALPPTIARLMTMAIETPGLLSLAAGFTDNRTLPAHAVAETVYLLAKERADPEYLQYGTNQGRLGLRRVLAQRLHRTEPGLSVETLERSMLVTNGSQQALYLAAQVLCDPGDVVLVDRPSYFVFLEMLQGLGITARSMPTTDSGELDGPGLERVLDEMKATGESERLRAIYFVSYFSNPSARSLSQGEKTTLARALSLRGMRVPVIEDAAYRELYFREPEPAQSVLSHPEWQAFPRLYLSTLTKSFATGLKVGFGICTSPEWLKKMLHVKGHHDFGTANFNQAVFEQVCANGGFDRQLGTVRATYLSKMEALHAALGDAGLPELGWKWSKPTGGLYLWLRAPAGLETGLDSPFCHHCLAKGVVYVPGELCFGDVAPKNYVRLSFGVLQERDLREAATRFVNAAQDFV